MALLPLPKLSYVEEIKDTERVDRVDLPTLPAGDTGWKAVPLTKVKKPVQQKLPVSEDKKGYTPEYDALQYSGLVEDGQEWYEADSDERKAITSDMVKGNKLWIDSAKTIYKDEEDRDFAGTDEEAAEWLLDRQAKFNWDITDLALTTASSDDWDDKTKQAWLDSMTIYDAMDADASTWGSSAWHAITDPTFLPSFLLGFGVGGIAKTLGGKGASLAGKFAFKEVLKNSLVKEGLRKGLSKKAAIALAEKSSKGGGKAALSVLGKESVLAARKEAAKGLAKRQGMWAGGIGAGYGATDDILRQAVERDIDPELEYDPLRTVMAGGIGGIAGGVIGAGIPRVGEFIGRSKIHRAADVPSGKTDYGIEKTFNETLEKAGDDVLNIESTVDEAADRVSPDGFLTLSAGKITEKIKTPEYKKHLKDEGFKNKSNHVESLLNLRFKNVKKKVNKKTGEIIFEASEK